MKKIVFTLILVLMLAVFFLLVWKVTRSYLDRGEDLNVKAWESSYLERGQPVPESGPREGYWGARVGNKVGDDITIWREPEIHLAGKIDIDAFGRQRYSSSVKPEYRILIIGGSVAGGAYASSISTTYFNILGKELERRGVPVEIVIVAAGAWKSSQEVRALKHNIRELNPDLVVFLDGLNDLTNGATSQTLYGEPAATHDGSQWTVLYHSHDYDQRVADYLRNMEDARNIAMSHGAVFMVVLQPSLNERSKRTPVEETLLNLTLEAHSSSTALTNAYTGISKGLSAQAQTGKLYFIDCSKAFDSEKETYFSDIWHFSDFGHAILGRIMGDTIYDILRTPEQLKSSR
ncbi:MAG: SGNH/GDSL hydrolase family protein [Desulfuromonadaceae bacterium]|nr:SGNH/GDSL hydrolase family protein [Desulfuromonadaceae bacterium]MDD2855770.1 SGNH/GDSL hydrolase family protein [Desulfuromonadaceae bacterium]